MNAETNPGGTISPEALGRIQLGDKRSIKGMPREEFMAAYAGALSSGINPGSAAEARNKREEERLAGKHTFRDKAILAVAAGAVVTGLVVGGYELGGLIHLPSGTKPNSGLTPSPTASPSPTPTEGRSTPQVANTPAEVSTETATPVKTPQEEGSGGNEPKTTPTAEKLNLFAEQITPEEDKNGRTLMHFLGVPDNFNNWSMARGQNVETLASSVLDLAKFLAQKENKNIDQLLTGKEKLSEESMSLLKEAAKQPDERSLMEFLNSHNIYY